MQKTIAAVHAAAGVAPNSVASRPIAEASESPTGIDQAQQEARARSIINHPAAKGREAVARRLASESHMTEQEAISFLTGLANARQGMSPPPGYPGFVAGGDDEAKTSHAQISATWDKVWAQHDAAINGVPMKRPGGEQ